VQNQCRCNELSGGSCQLSVTPTVFTDNRHLTTVNCVADTALKLGDCGRRQTDGGNNSAANHLFYLMLCNGSDDAAVAVTRC